MKNILVPTDYSETAQNAANFAIQFAKAFNAKIILFHSYHIPVPTNEVPIMVVTPQEMEKENMEMLKKYVNEIKKTDPALQIEYVCTPGFAADEIENYTQKNQIDLIVMGIKGAGKLSQILIGSTSTSVIKRVKIPILIIPEGAIFKTPSKIVFATDYSEVPDKQALDSLKKIINVFKAKLLVLNLLKHGETATVEKAATGVKLESYLSDVDHSLFFPEEKDVTEGINKFIESHQAELIVMMPHKHKLLERVFTESNTKKMAFHTNIPLLVISE